MKAAGTAAGASPRESALPAVLGQSIGKGKGLRRASRTELAGCEPRSWQTARMTCCRGAAGPSTARVSCALLLHPAPRRASELCIGDKPRPKQRAGPRPFPEEAGPQPWGTVHLAIIPGEPSPEQAPAQAWWASSVGFRSRPLLSLPLCGFHPWLLRRGGEY